MIPDDLSIPLASAQVYTGPFENPTAELGALPIPAPVPYLPFGIVPKSGTSATVTVLGGFVGDTMDATASLTITNINTALSVASNSKIFLKGDVTSLATTALTVTVASTWTGYPALIHTTGSPAAQDHYYVLIGFVGSVPASPAQNPGVPITISGTQYWIYQTLRNDLMVETICSDGTPAIYPYAFQSPVR